FCSNGQRSRSNESREKLKYYLNEHCFSLVPLSFLSFFSKKLFSKELDILYQRDNLTSIKT
ncbi:hypothetical protein GIB67_022128, partial [Kingdonia uniflora]